MRYRWLFAHGMARPLAPKVFKRLGKFQIKTQRSFYGHKRSPLYNGAFRAK